MPFDINTAKPISKGFDIGTAKSIEETDEIDYSIGPKETSLQTAKPLNPMERLNQGLAKIFEADKTEQGARASNEIFLAKDIMKEKGVSLSDALLEVRNNYDEIVAKRYGSYTPRQQLKEGLSKVSTPLAVAGMIAAPIPTALGIAGFSALEAGKEKLIQSNPNLSESSKLGLDLATILGGGKAIQGAFRGVPKGLKGSAASLAGKVTAETRKNVASGLMNSLIRAKAKDAFFGKDPGLTLAQEKIVGNNFDTLLIRTSERLKEYDDNLVSLLSSEKNKNRIDDYTPAIKPLADAIKKTSLFPRMAKTATAKLMDAYKDILGIVQDPKTGKTTQTRDMKMNPLEATELRRRIEDLDIINWNKEAPMEDKILSKAMKEVYRGINRIIDKADPNITKVNRKIADLVTAKKLIKMQGDYLSTKDPIFYGSRVGGLFGLLSGNISGVLTGMAIEKALVSPALRTRVASWLVSAPKEKIVSEFSQTPEMIRALEITFKGNKLLTSKINQAQKLLAVPSTTYGEGFSMKEATKGRIEKAIE
jgi:hypothetical protein